MWCIRCVVNCMYLIFVWTRWWFLLSLQFFSLSVSLQIRYLYLMLCVFLCFSSSFSTVSHSHTLSHSPLPLHSYCKKKTPSSVTLTLTLALIRSTSQSSFSFSSTLNNTYDRRVHFLIIYANFHALGLSAFFSLLSARSRLLRRSLGGDGPENRCLSNERESDKASTL